ncbi:RNA polymerase sigma factor [Rhodanobacter sp. Col0626]|uniref:RNA polymerase sigma factor n=1 Tax=Rhodanobacter sp. Col0626 TaxID=3415679 RepID=UPI003CF459C5
MGQQSADNGVPPVMPAGFEAFVRQQRAELVSYLRRRITSDEDVEDIVQESLIRLMRYRDRDPASWAPLLYRIAINVHNDRLRQLRVRQDIQCVHLDENIHEMASLEPGHVQRIATQQELARLQRALLRLPTRCRQMYLLHRIEGMTYPQIASHCGIGVKAVEKHISKALVLLRVTMASED